MAASRTESTTLLMPASPAAGSAGGGPSRPSAAARPAALPPSRRLYLAGLRVALGVAQRAVRGRAWWRARHPPLAPAASLSAAWGPLGIVHDLPRGAAAPLADYPVADILAHRVWLYGTRYDLGPRVDWQADPATGRRFDPSQGFDQHTGGDIKRVWKLSCAHHLLLAAAQAAATGAEGSAASVLRELDGWLLQNPAGEGPNWWSPMEVALRTVSWALILLLLREQVGRAPADLQERLQRGLVAHGNFVWTRLEDLGLRSNHYVANLTGLYVLGLVFEGLPGAPALRAWAAARLARACRTQLRPDGVHREFSSHYHRFVAELFLLPVFLARAAGRGDFPPACEERLRAMLRVLSGLANAGGILPQIGDNDSEIVCCVGLEYTAEPRDIRPFLAAAEASLNAQPGAGALSLQAVLTLLGVSGRGPSAGSAGLAGGSDWLVYPSAGWHIWRAPGVELLAVCGPVGSDGLGAHDHAHVNEVLLSLDGREVLVDPGTGCYTADPGLRNRLRSASAHGCAFPGREPASWLPGVNGLFHLEGIWQARARVDGGELHMEARYGGIAHERRVRPRSGGFSVEDRFNRILEGARVQWVLHPDVQLVQCRGGTCRVRRGGATLTLVTDAGDWEMAAVRYSDRFGQCGTTRALRTAMFRPVCTTTLEVRLG